MTLKNPILWLAAVLLMAACAKQDLTEAPEDIGDFRLGFNIVVAKNAKPVGPSRKAEPEEWEVLLKDRIAAHIGRYAGEKIYNIGVGVDAYALAIPGIPVVLSPKSVLVVTVNIWDDAVGQRINEEPEQIIVFERLSGETLVGSGLTQTREVQMQNLAENAARLINLWLVENKAWFTAEAVAARAGLPVPVPPATAVPLPAAPPPSSSSPPPGPVAPGPAGSPAPLVDASGDVITLP